MNDFDEPFWCLDQVTAWASTRDPEMVGFAASASRTTRLRSSFEILFKCAEIQEHKLAEGRDIEEELWRSSGWDREQFRTHSDVLPEPGPMNNALIEALAEATKYDRLQIQYCLSPHHSRETKKVFLTRIRNVELKKRAEGAIEEGETHGPPWRVYGCKFPIIDYLLFLFRTGRLRATGNLPSGGFSRQISPEDWAALEIRTDNHLHRICVWRTGGYFELDDQMDAAPYGDIVNIRVRRDDILLEFPADPPERNFAEHEVREVIRAAIRANGGYIGQEKGAEIVRAKFPGFGKKRAMALVKEETGNEKPGPKGPRNNRAKPRA
jgi:hypothetical protein